MLHKMGLNRLEYFLFNLRKELVINTFASGVFAFLLKDKIQDALNLVWWSFLLRLTAYAAAYIPYCMALSTLFSKSTMATTLGALLLVAQLYELLLLIPKEKTDNLLWLPMIPGYKLLIE